MRFFSAVRKEFTEAARLAELSIQEREAAVFGHSMGAGIAFEVARELRRRNLAAPRYLFVSGRRARQIPETEAITYNLPDADLISELRRLNGTPHEVLQN